MGQSCKTLIPFLLPTIHQGGLIMSNYQQLRQALCEGILDNMDLSEMSQFIYDSLELSYDKYTDNELKSEIEEQLGEEHLASVLDSLKEKG